MGPVLRNLKVWYMLQERGHSHPQQGFPLPIHTVAPARVWQNHELACSYPTGKPGLGDIGMQKTLLHGGVNPLVLGVRGT